MSSHRISVQCPRALIAAAFVTILSQPAVADDPAAEHRLLQAPLEVTVSGLPSLKVIAPGSGPAGGPRGFCPQVQETYSDQQFSGQGTFSLPPGMVEQEIAAATFTVPSTDWPVLIDFTEIVWAQSHSNPTTTAWTYFVWQGTPASGTIVSQISSDGDLVPHINLPVGTARAVVLGVTIDPGDPEQIIVQNNGSNQFSVGFRIDSHNNSPVAPCSCGLGSLPAICCPPNASQNAWPAMDSGGLNFGNNNWLFARDCPGSTGLCDLVPNGWFRLSDPSLGGSQFVKDWAIRVLYTPLNCTLPMGACCTGGSCSEMGEGSCNAISGTYQGDGVLCADVSCPQPEGACCFMPSGCFNTTSANCEAADGEWRGIGSLCETIVCYPRGACCLPDGSCTEDTSDTDCAAAGGFFNGDGTTCEQVFCPQPIGACCLNNGNCLELEEFDCAQIPMSHWAGFGSDCLDGDINGTADDCEAGDPCDGAIPGDFDGSTVVNGADIQGFITALLSGSPTPAELCAGDFNVSGTLDAGDIPGLVSAVLD